MNLRAVNRCLQLAASGIETEQLSAIREARGFTGEHPFAVFATVTKQPANEKVLEEVVKAAVGVGGFHATNMFEVLGNDEKWRGACVAGLFLLAERYARELGRRSIDTNFDALERILGYNALYRTKEYRDLVDRVDHIFYLYNAQRILGELERGLSAQSPVFDFDHYFTAFLLAVHRAKEEGTPALDRADETVRAEVYAKTEEFELVYRGKKRIEEVFKTVPRGLNARRARKREGITT